MKPLFIIATLFLAVSNARAEVFSFALAKASVAEEGDIVAVRPADWGWGKKEREQFFIVLIDCGDMFERWQDAHAFFTSPLTADGSMTPGPEVKLIKENRFRVFFDDIKNKASSKGVNIDLTKIRNEKMKYQPVKESKMKLDFAALVHDKHLKRKLANNDVAELKKAKKKASEKTP